MSDAEGSKVAAFGKTVAEEVVVGVDVANIMENIEAEGVAATVAAEDDGKLSENCSDAILKSNGCSSKVAGNDVGNVDGNNIENYDKNEDASIDKVGSARLSTPTSTEEKRQDDQEQSLPTPPPLPPKPKPKQNDLAYKCFAGSIKENQDNSSIKINSLQPHVLVWAKSRLKSVRACAHTSKIKVSKRFCQSYILILI